jgi:hypothetical protein
LAVAGQQEGHGKICPVIGQTYPSALATLTGALALSALQKIVSVLAELGEPAERAMNAASEMKSIIMLLVPSNLGSNLR